ncbi:MAG: ATP-dependent DNA helicase [Candidatus Nanohaloarchaeota archaeon QJJ-5]|nr:ATP-dependent DNA helicase [Candidatus Nanohaloarchaeota archaeon QJJ-5]
MDLFPYDTVRDEQSDMKAHVEEALEEGENVVAHAPTGLGKTAATVPSSLRHALDEDRTVFFLTPRHSQHEIAVETLQEIKDRHGVSFTAVDLIGKRWLCEGETGASVYIEGEENSCPRHDATYTENHQLTKQAKRKKRELEQEVLRAEEVKERCEKVCPYEILLHMAADADVVIGDYFHIFHPGVREAVFGKSDLKLDDCVLIVDEAHNLADRTRRLNSATLTEQQLQSAITEASKHGFYEEETDLEKLKRELGRMAKQELGMEREAEIDQATFEDRVENITDYDHLLEDLSTLVEEVRDQGEESETAEIVEFLDRWQGTDTGFVRVLQRRQSANNSYVRLSYTCLDPQYATRRPLKKAHTAIAMSGTLEPLSMYVDILGFDEKNTHAVSYESPFPEANKLNLMVDKVTTRYKERDQEQYQKIAWYITKSKEQVDGNVGVFFPSYKMRNEIYDVMRDDLECPVYQEQRGMDKEEKNELVEEFTARSDEGAILLGVVGGSFGEGVDFPGEAMSGVFIVGLPLQRPDLETKALIDFYDDRFGRGWDYGYNFPAVNRALQAAGRCIRSSDDRGVVMFLDERYTWSKYRKALPDERYIQTKAPWQDIRAFFGN